MKVNFLIVGAQKSGTSALDIYLRNHPEVEMAKDKEVHFFDTEDNFTAEVDYSGYHACFENRSASTIKGEATPIYMYWYPAPRRIWEYNPNMKLIAVLRNPIDRAYSHWNMMREKTFEAMSFSDAIRAEDERCREALPLQHRQFSYVSRGYYTDQLRRLWHFFPRHQTLILKYESLRHDLEDTLFSVTEFIGISRFKKVKYKDTHSRKYTFKMSEADRNYLRRLYYHEIKELEAMFGWDCSDWVK